MASTRFLASGLPVALALFLACFVSETPATLTLPKTLDDLVRESDLIFVGTVEEVRSQWADREKQSVETIVSFRVLTALRGAGGETVALRFAGGEVEGIREVVAGVPEFERGQRYVVFARATRAVSPLVGFDQGCLRVVGSEGELYVTDLAGRKLRIADGRLVPTATGDATEALSLEGLLSAVRSRLSEGPRP
ncbi:MAG: hypothetical protein KatS3mg076_1102 [Candidatus Binatia bacterium]|nr:MAG: hypothetical protein KatS3mg076_1102 [Candidatus Binatia bacterium]